MDEDWDEPSGAAPSSSASSSKPVSGWDDAPASSGKKAAVKGWDDDDGGNDAWSSGNNRSKNNDSSSRGGGGGGNRPPNQNNRSFNNQNSNNRSNGGDDWGSGGGSTNNRSNQSSNGWGNNENKKDSWGGGGGGGNRQSGGPNNRPQNRSNDDDWGSGGGSNNRPSNNSNKDSWGGGGGGNRQSGGPNNRPQKSNNDDDWGSGGGSNNRPSNNSNNSWGNDNKKDSWGGGGGGNRQSGGQNNRPQNNRSNDNDDWGSGGGGGNRQSNSKPSNPFNQNKRNNNDDDWGSSGGNRQSKPNNSNSGGWGDDGNNDDWGSGGNKSKPKSNGWGDDNKDDGWGSNADGNNRGVKRGRSDDQDNGGNKRGNDWSCSCGHSNFSFRKECQKCKGPKPQGGSDSFGNSGGGEKKREWDCTCGHSNFSFRKECQKCNEPKPQGGSGSFGNSGGGGNKRGNEWNCSCGHSNFGFRKECQKCNESKPQGGSDSFGNDGDGGDKKKRGPDWSCECGHSNFSFRRECQKCNDPKPKKEGEEEEDPDKPQRVTYIPTEATEEELVQNSISTGINFDNYDKIPVDVTGDNKPDPCTSFRDSGLVDYLLERVEECKYTKPTPIQKYAMPMIMAKRDIMACAQTGSGKTAAFLLPIIHRLMKEKVPITSGKPNVLIMTPTRELAIQIHEEARKFSRGSIIKTAIAYGGAEVRSQLARIRDGCHILVGTPGRLNQYIERGDITFDEIKFLILDEADRMLDMGFKSDIEKVAGHQTMPPAGDRETLMFSATFPAEIQQLAGNYLKNYLFLRVGIVGGACENIKQMIYQVKTFEKRNKLMDILKECDPQGTIVFVEKKVSADFLASYLSEMKISSTSMHGDRLQQQREEALREFKCGKRKILIATSVAARGLDIKGVTHVINYDLPKSIDEYVHRIGRTGRVGNSGRATSFFDEANDMEIASGLSRILRDANQEVPDFLPNATGDDNYNENAFGGHDVRQEAKSSSAPQAHGAQEEEEW